MLSCVRLFATLWTAACQDPLSMGFPRQEYWEWVAISSFRGSSWPRDRTCISWVRRQFFLPLCHLGSPFFPILNNYVCANFCYNNLHNNQHSRSAWHIYKLSSNSNASLTLLMLWLTLHLLSKCSSLKNEKIYIKVRNLISSSSGFMQAIQLLPIHSVSKTYIFLSGQGWKFRITIIIRYCMGKNKICFHCKLSRTGWCTMLHALCF